MKKNAGIFRGKIFFVIFALFVAAVFGFFIYVKTAVAPIQSEDKEERAQITPLSQQEAATTQVAEKKADNPSAPVSISRSAFQAPGQLLTHLFDVKGLVSPKAAAFSPDGKEIWVTSLLNERAGVYVLDAKTGEKIKDINLDGGGGVEVLFSKDGKRGYVSQMENNRVFEIDADSKEILRVFDTKGAWTKILAFSPDGGKLYASNWVDDNISEFDLESGELLRLIPTVNTPRGLYITPDGNYLYAAGFGYGEIQKIDLETGKGRVIFKSGGAMRHFAVDEERQVLFASDMGKSAIYKLDLTNDEVLKFADTDLNTNTIVLSPDKKVLFVSCRGENYSATDYSRPGPEWGSVLLFDANTGKMLDAVVGGNQPTALDISPDGKLLVFSDFLDGRLEFYQVPSYETLLAGNGGRSSVYKAEMRK